MAGEPFIRLLNRAKSSRRLSVPIPGIIDKQRHLSLMYQPPFSISSAAVNLIAEISALVERYAIRLERSDGLRLRKASRIKTIYSSLALEGNRLSEHEVRDVLQGKTVVAPLREIQEVRNAIKTYELYSSLDAFSLSDLLKAHGVMMSALADDAGSFRRGGVGVFAGTSLVHMAPPADRVPGLMNDLFEWLRQAEDHLLIRSCVFHYEFEIIHPFSDGNGRMGRLWQSLLLGKLHPAFEHLPVENMVYANQQAYYEAISASSARVDCAPFVEFMLREILKTLQHHRNPHEDVGINGGINVGINLTPAQQRLVELIKRQPRLSVREMAERLELSQRQAERVVASLREKNVIWRVGSNKSGYWEVLD